MPRRCAALLLLPIMVIACASQQVEEPAAEAVSAEPVVVLPNKPSEMQSLGAVQQPVPPTQNGYNLCESCPAKSEKNRFVRRPLPEREPNLLKSDGSNTSSIPDPDQVTDAVAVYFHHNSAELVPAAQLALKRIVATHAYSGRYARVRVRGYTDDVGERLYNASLAKRRADKVYQFISQEAAAVVGLAYQVTGEGKCCFIALNDAEPGRARNRRVEVEFLP